MIHMAGEYIPFEEKKTIIAKIFKREADLLQKLRKHSFGKFVIHKMNGVLIRVELQSSELINEDEEIDLS